jgi:site-specific DNA-cytosine methylase
VSKSGKSGGIRKGSNTTSSLLWKCERAIEVKRPKYCIMENVKALVTKQKTKKDDDTEPTIMIEDFLEWEFTMCTYGYWNYLKVLDAADFGVPQHRERTIMVSIRKDNEEDPHYVFPVVQNLKPTTIDSILDVDVGEKNYLPDEKVRSFIAILASANKNILPERMPVVKEETIKNCHPVKKIITPTTKNGLATTLMASSYIKSRDITYLLSTGHYPKTGVVEIRKSLMDLECEKVNWGKLSAKYKKNRDLCNNSREEILSAVRNLNGSQFIRLRDLTAAECLRLMSVPKEYMDRMLDPEVELKKLNYSEDAIKAMMTLSTTNKKTGKVIEKYITTNESALKKMAGNSIVVDVLYYVLKSLFINIIHIK